MNFTTSPSWSGRLLSFLLVVGTFTIAANAATQSIITGPVGSGAFGSTVVILPNGNYVITDPSFDVNTAAGLQADAGAVYLYDGATHALISTMTGGLSVDAVGLGGVVVLANGDYVVKSPNWSLDLGNGSRISSVGAASYCKADTGCSGLVSSSNSLTGSSASDRVGTGVFALPNGKFVVESFQWGQGRGALTLLSPLTGTSGTIDSSNSLVGEFGGDNLGNVTVLPNGNYVASTFRWNTNRGAVRICNSTSGCTGMISAANSLVGTNSGDSIGNTGIKVLPNGNIVVLSGNWNGNRGAVTLVDTATGQTGQVSSSNSLVGSSANDFVGGLNTVTALTNANYVAVSPSWKNTGGVGVGAATLCSGSMGCTGAVTAQNSLVGNVAGDFQLPTVTALTNGNYVIGLPRFTANGVINAGAATLVDGVNGRTGVLTAASSFVGDTINGSVAGCGVTALTNGNYVICTMSWNSSRGAATWGSGTTGVVGTPTLANSLIGSSPGDQISGGGITALTNGNYVVSSPSWDGQRGAATLGNGGSGTVGEVSSVNSLVGSAALDRVGNGGSTALVNGNYVVRSTAWRNAGASDCGAATWGNGTTGITGPVSAANSLVGSLNDNVGQNGIVALPDGNYVVVSFSWNGARGAVTTGDGSAGTIGPISSSNSLVGSTSGDKVGTTGNDRDIKVYADGSFIVRSSNWRNGTLQDAGAISLRVAGRSLVGPISSANSVLGTGALGGFRLVYDYRGGKMLVGHAGSIATVFRPTSNANIFDFDGDGKTDVGIFRPSVAEWWINRSSDSTTYAAQFGASSDRITPGDYTGDGKADIAVFRPNSGEWYVLRSEDSSFFSFPFGNSTDTASPADYDNDGKTDAAVFRPSSATWFIRRSSDGGTTIEGFGQSTDIVAPADYDGDGKADIAIYRPSLGQWWISRSTAGVIAFTFGSSADKPVQGDYTGDGKADVAFFRPSTGEWFVLRSNDFSFYSVPFGNSSDIVAPGDYDGDGRFDTAIFRPSETNWYVNRSTAGLLIGQFGASGDRPIPNAYVP